jgi:membrane protease subunit (stomatin/prohibitin family)
MRAARTADFQSARRKLEGEEETMGLLDRLNPLKQFIEVIEWLDETGDTMVYRFPVQDQEIKNGAQLIVRESQVAAFVHQGQIADIFPPGRHTVDGGNVPILSKLQAWPYGFNSPFKSEVYFISTKQFTDQKWGTMNPIMLRDADFGVVRLRAFGNYSMKISDPRAFLTQCVGTNGRFETEDIEGQLKSMVVSEFTDALGEAKIAALDLAANYKEMGQLLRTNMNEDFKTYGLEVVKFVIENISVPPEVEAAMDKRASMGALGDMNKYMQYQAAEAMRDAAQNPSGGAGLGAGLGAGFGVGNIMANAMSGVGQQQQAAQPPAAQEKCPSCGASNAAGTKFCNECGAKMQVAMVACVAGCGAQVKEGAKFCNECGAKQEKPKCSGCQAEVAPGAKFCNECGAKLS